MVSGSEDTLSIQAINLLGQKVVSQWEFRQAKVLMRCKPLLAKTSHLHAARATCLRLSGLGPCGM